MCSRHHHNQDTETVASTPKYSLQLHLCGHTLLSHQPLGITHLFSLCLFQQSFTLNQIVCDLFDAGTFTPKCLRSLSNILQETIFHSYECWLILYYEEILPFVYPLICEGHLSGFQIW